MIQVCKKNNLVLYEYSPSITRPFFINMEPLSLRRRIRMFLAYLYDYKVYYLRENDEYVAYCLVQSGKDRRYKFANENDILVGPYFVSEKHRGRKLSITLLNLVLEHNSYVYKRAFDYIHEDNVPSIKASEAVGFELFSKASVSKFTRSINEESKGEYLIFKYINNKVREVSDD